MRDIDALLNSLVNIDRNSLVANLSSEAEAARQLITAARSRTASQRGKRRDAEQHAARVDRMLLFFPACHSAASGSARSSNHFVRGVSRETRPFPASTPNRIACGCKGRCNASSEREPARTVERMFRRTARPARMESQWSTTFWRVKLAMRTEHATSYFASTRPCRRGARSRPSWHCGPWATKAFIICQVVGAIDV
jgi:hypothetical protein